MEKKSLIALSIETAQLEAIAQNTEGELSPELEALYDELSKDVPAKVDRYGFFIKKLESSIEFLKGQAKMFALAAKRLENVILRLKDMARYSMEITNTTELKGENYKFNLQRTKPVMEINEELLPREYWKQVVTSEPDRDLIEARIKQGEVISGVTIKENTALYLRVGAGK